MRLARSAKTAKTMNTVNTVKTMNTARDADIHYRVAKAKSEGFTVADACSNSSKTDSQYTKFIFFGCWNNIDCKKEYIYRDIVLDYIRDNEKDIKQLYIAGDNWYQNTMEVNRENFKVYLTDILITGYAKLYAMKKDVYIAVGNHDEDKDDEDKDNILKKDCNINTQKHYLKELKDGRSHTMFQPTLEYLNMLAITNQFADNYLCENGVYIYVDNIGVRYNKGNIVIIINTNRFDNYDTGIKYLRSIRAVIGRVLLNKRKEQIFVMGHIPLFGFKNDTIHPHKVNMILKLFDIFVKNNIIYLCADTHNFSIMRIVHEDKVVIQITAGTGGADPDVLTREYSDSSYKVKCCDDKFNIQAYALNSYGYVTINTENTANITISYTQIISAGNSDKHKKAYTYSYVVTNTDKNIAYHSKTERVAFTIDSSATSVKTKVCKQNQNGFITSKDRSIACYKKKIKNKTLSSNK